MGAIALDKRREAPGQSVASRVRSYGPMLPGEGMERLSFFDQALHKITTSGLPPLYMQGVIIVDPAKSKVRITPEVVGGHIAARLEQLPILRKKLVQDVLHLGDVFLVDDPAFDMGQRINYSTVPAPGDTGALLRHLAQFSAGPPASAGLLWRFEVISGLADGRIAIAMQVAHSIMDGEAALQLLQALFDSGPRKPDKPRRTPWRPGPEPTHAALLLGALQENADRAVRRAPALLGAHSGKLLTLAAGVVRDRATQDSGKPRAQVAASGRPRRTSLNGAISSDRRVLAFRSFRLDHLKRISHRFDCKVNDVVLLMASEALRRYFEGIGEPLDFDLFAAMPLSMRQHGDARGGNVIRLTKINLHNTTADLPQRLTAIARETRIVKSDRVSALGGASGGARLRAQDVLGLLSPLVLDVLCAAARIMAPWNYMPLLANTVVTNVSGPRQALYLAGMPIEEQVPVTPMFHTVALGIGVISFGNTLTFGFHGCGRAIREQDMHLFVDGLSTAYRSLDALAAKSARRWGATAARVKLPRRPPASRSRAAQKGR